MFVVKNCWGTPIPNGLGSLGHSLAHVEIWAGSAP